MPMQIQGDNIALFLSFSMSELNTTPISDNFVLIILFFYRFVHVSIRIRMYPIFFPLIYFKKLPNYNSNITYTLKMLSICSLKRLS